MNPGTIYKSYLGFHLNLPLIESLLFFFLRVTLDKCCYLHVKGKEEIEGFCTDVNLIMLIPSLVKSPLCIEPHNRPSKYSTGVPSSEGLRSGRPKVFFKWLLKFF